VLFVAILYGGWIKKKGNNTALAIITAAAFIIKNELK